MQQKPEIEFRILQQGDDVERNWGEQIVAVLPSYAAIWEIYVGNDQFAAYLPMLDVDPGVLKKRREVWERIYTLFESLALCWSLEEQLTFTPDIDDYPSYADNLNRWLSFYANLGRIHDMADDIATHVDANHALDGFFEARNIVLHGPKMPMKWSGPVLLSPPLGEGAGQWDDKRKLWQDMNQADFKALGQRLTDLLRALEPLLDQFLWIVHGQLGAKLGFRPVVWPIAAVIPDAGANASSPPAQVTRPFGMISGLEREPGPSPSSVD